MSNYKKVVRSCLVEFQRYFGIINVKVNFRK